MHAWMLRRPELSANRSAEVDTLLVSLFLSTIINIITNSTMSMFIIMFSIITTINIIVIIIMIIIISSSKIMNITFRRGGHAEAPLRQVAQEPAAQRRRGPGLLRLEHAQHQDRHAGERLHHHRPGAEPPLGRPEALRGRERDPARRRVPPRALLGPHVGLRRPARARGAQEALGQVLGDPRGSQAQGRHPAVQGRADHLRVRAGPDGQGEDVKIISSNNNDDNNTQQVLYIYIYICVYIYIYIYIYATTTTTTTTTTTSYYLLLPTTTIICYCY